MVRSNRLKPPPPTGLCIMKTGFEMCSLVTLAVPLFTRCNIPVILMGETGCGKTRLLRYLCELQAKYYGTRNLLTMKVCQPLRKTFYCLLYIQCYNLVLQ